MFYGKIITHPMFEGATPINVYHREHAPFSYSHPEGMLNLHFIFKKSFEIAKKCGTLRFSADDYAKIYINGKLAAMGPAQGYHFRYNFCEVDVSEYLREGENEITAVVYYQGLINRAYVSGDMRCAFVCDLISGGEVVLSSDESWQCQFDPRYTGLRRFGYDTQFLEDMDMRIPLEAPVFAVENKFDYAFADEPFQMLDIREVTPEVMIRREGSIVCDFGGEVVGTLKITAKGRDGDVIEIRAAEELEVGVEGALDEASQIRWNCRANCPYSENVILAEGENLIDGYDYKAFRYAEVKFPESVEILSFTAVLRRYPTDEDACTLECSDEVLKQVFELCKRGVLWGSQEVYVDCPGREKGQYAGDLTITSASQMWLGGDTRLFAKAMRDQADSAFICEGIMAVTPGSLMQEIADYSLQFPIIALRYYEFTGDITGLRRYYETAERMLAFFRRFEREDGLIEGVDKWNLVDWPTNQRDDYDFPMTKPIGKGVHNVINAFYVGATIGVEKIASILGVARSDDAPTSNRLISAYEAAFYRPELGLYADSETSSHTALHSNVLPLYYGFEKAESRENIVSLIREKGFVCGVYMAYFTLKALAGIGLYDDVYDMITSCDTRSWYNMVREGGSACFEAWGKEMKGNTSLCHPWASSPISILIEDIIGVKAKSPGFGEVEVVPHLPAKVGALDMRIPLPSGRLVHFKRCCGRDEITIE